MRYLLLALLMGCTPAHIKLGEPETTRVTITVEHHDPPIVHNGRRVLGWARWSRVNESCTIHLPKPDPASWDRYMRILGHEAAHCFYGAWHSNTPTYMENGHERLQRVGFHPSGIPYRGCRDWIDGVHGADGMADW